MTFKFYDLFLLQPGRKKKHFRGNFRAIAKEKGATTYSLIHGPDGGEEDREAEEGAPFSQDVEDHNPVCLNTPFSSSPICAFLVGINHKYQFLMLSITVYNSFFFLK